MAAPPIDWPASFKLWKKTIIEALASNKNLTQARRLERAINLSIIWHLNFLTEEDRLKVPFNQEEFKKRLESADDLN